MLPEDKIRLKHMLDASIEAQTFMKGITLESLKDNRLVMQAVIRSIEIIGEAASKISKDVRECFPEIPRKSIIGMRNWLIHAYYDIDSDHVWNTVHKDLQVLIPQLKEILGKE